MEKSTIKHLESLENFEFESFRNNRAFCEWASHVESGLTLKLGVTGKGYYKVIEEKTKESHSWNFQVAQSAIDKYSEILRKHENE